MLLVLLAERVAGEGIGGRPLLLLAVLMTVLGVQAIALGLIGEMIVHFNVGRSRRYRVKDEGADFSARQPPNIIERH